MRTLEEAIEYEEELVSYYNNFGLKKEVEKHEQNAEWLKELKELRESNESGGINFSIKISRKDLEHLVDIKVKEFELDVEKIRSKAVDDCLEVINLLRNGNFIDSFTYGYILSDFEEIRKSEDSHE